MTPLELTLLIFVLAAGLSIVVSTLRTGISPMISSGKACRAMLAVVDDTINSPVNNNPSTNGPLIDLGSGWGTLVIAVARKYPNRQVIGYELSWLPWFISIIRKYSLRLDNLTIYRQDFNKADLSRASILLCYLFPGGMTTLHEKLKRELFNKVVIVSNTFALPSCQAIKVTRLKDIYQTPIYLYHWPPES